MPGSPLASVRFRVRDLEAQRRFYEQVLGVTAREASDDRVRLGLGEEGFTVELARDPDAVARPRPTVGLFHLAYLLPDRRSLAEAVLHLRDGEVAIEGVADHGVSEAVYLSDAEGNGIELYRDRPREEWPTKGEHVAMVTDPLDTDELLATAEGPAPLPAGTQLGHIHLHVGELATAERFFADGLGLRVRQRDFPGALFLAEDDYHHHVGANTWARGRQAPAEAVGLARYTWEGDLDAIGSRLAAQDRDVEDGGDELLVEDPAGVLLRVVDA